MAFTEDFTEADRDRQLDLVQRLKKEVNDFYWRLFFQKTGAEFHAFVEWCGVMGEHLNIVETLLKDGKDAMNMNRHTGETLPIPDYQLKYLAEKMECIFDGAIEVKVREPENV